jgi:hypothetical protein
MEICDDIVNNPPESNLIVAMQGSPDLSCDVGGKSLLKLQVGSQALHGHLSTWQGSRAREG